MLRRFAVLAIAFAFALVAATAPADAHFVLKTPESWTVQGGLGDPQKLGPCGSDGTVTPSGIVTRYEPGDTVAITFNEVIFHPGHYRVALSVNDRSELPAEPVVTAGANTPCGTVPIMSPVVFPVLADGALVHDKPLSGTQTIQVKLPTNVTCPKCTLQVIEFMSDHPLNMPGGCFYHHCADIAIGVAPPDAGTSSPAMSSGCACSSANGSPATGGLFALFGISVLLRRTKL